jgi:DNA polymerase-1
MPRLYLIDGSSQMYRAYHAPVRTAEGTPLRDAQGRPTNAVYIFVTMLRKLLKEQQPEYIAASFDLPGPTFRDELAADYKANRAPMPPDLAEQIPLVHEACEALGVPILSSERFEADDVIGTLAEKAARAGFEVAIVTGDKDFLQLVRDGIKVYNPRDEGVWYDERAVRERFGVPPERVVDVIALMGDAIDNIRGVPGIGEKGARDLVATYGSLDALLARAAEIPQKRYREALQAHAESARRSRELARIRTDVPVEFDPEALRYRGASRERCFALFSALGFRSIVMDYAPTAATVERDYALVDTPEALEALARELAAARRFGLRLVAERPAPMRAAIVGIAVSPAPRRGRYVPVAHGGLGGTPNLPLARVLETLRPLLEDPAIAKVGHDLKPDLLLLERHGVRLAGVEADTMLASYVLDATRPGHRLEELALDHLGYRAIEDEELLGRGSRALSPAELAADAALAWAAERADLALQLAGRLAERLQAEQLEALYRELELPLVPVLVAMERAGVRIDGAALAAQSQRIEQELHARSRQIYELAGVEFNINSPRQLAEVLFDRLALPALKRTGKTRAASTAVDVLEELALLHDLPRLVLEWRALQKLKGTYIDALPQLIHPETGRVHTSFNQAVAATGRLSSSDPNLQNIPIRTELGREIRRAFVADPGRLLISADYSQIELRVLAHLSGEPALIEAFRRGEDIHDRTARQIFGAASGLDPHELRRRAKIVNYALLYGKTAFTLARDIGVPQAAAQQFIDAYFAGFPAVRRFIDETIARGRETGVVTTMFGRRRLVPELASRHGQIRAAAERVAVNLPVQGTAADILKKAMIDVHAALAPHGERARMILTVHDELLFEADRELADEIATLVRERMERAVELAVPLTVDVGIGANWKEAKA